MTTPSAWLRSDLQVPMRPSTSRRIHHRQSPSCRAHGSLRCTPPSPRPNRSTSTRSARHHTPWRGTVCRRSSRCWRYSAHLGSRAPSCSGQLNLRVYPVPRWSSRVELQLRVGAPSHRFHEGRPANHPGSTRSTMQKPHLTLCLTRRQQNAWQPPESFARRGSTNSAAFRRRRTPPSHRPAHRAVNTSPS